MNDATPALVFDGVTLRYSAAHTPALADISLTIRSGEVTWLYGALGAGCTSLLLAAAGLAPGHTGGELSGSVRALGIDPHDPRGRAGLVGRIGFVTAVPASQLSGVAATVREEVAFAPANLGWPVGRIEAAAAAALERFGLTRLAERDPAHLSGGELQRVIVASMLALGPALWLLDEPASALDRAGRESLRSLLAAEAGRGAAVVIASEDADTMLGVADRIVVLDGGRVALDGAPASVLAGPAVWQHAGGSTAIAALARSAAGLAEPVPAALLPPYPLTVDEGVARWS